jgi:cytoskeletal protein RodZ
MGSTAGTVALLVVIVALIVGGFVAFWIWDKSRADDQATDPERSAADPNAELRSDSFAQDPPSPSRDVPDPRA